MISYERGFIVSFSCAYCIGCPSSIDGLCLPILYLQFLLIIPKHLGWPEIVGNRVAKSDVLLCGFLSLCHFSFDRCIRNVLFLCGWFFIISCLVVHEFQQKSDFSMKCHVPVWLVLHHFLFGCSRISTKVDFNLVFFVAVWLVLHHFSSYNAIYFI